MIDRQHYRHISPWRAPSVRSLAAQLLGQIIPGRAADLTEGQRNTVCRDRIGGEIKIAPKRGRLRPAYLWKRGGCATVRYLRSSVRGCMNRSWKRPPAEAKASSCRWERRGKLHCGFCQVLIQLHFLTPRIDAKLGP